jgi:hypothetical protein
VSSSPLMHNVALVGVQVAPKIVIFVKKINEKINKYKLLIL